MGKGEGIREAPEFMEMHNKIIIIKAKKSKKVILLLCGILFTNICTCNSTAIKDRVVC